MKINGKIEKKDYLEEKDKLGFGHIISEVPERRPGGNVRQAIQDREMEDMRDV